MTTTAPRPAQARDRAASAAVLGALVLVTGVSPLATDAYMPGLPELARSLGASPAAGQLTLTAFIIGIALGQLFVGPISDATGRRPVLLATSTLFALSTAVCMVAPSAPTLIVARLVEGFVAGGGVAAGLAIVTDRYRGADAERQFGTLVAVNQLAPVWAPALGGAILQVGSWRTIFGVLTALGVLMVLGVVRCLPESLPADRRGGAGPRDALRRMADLATDRAYTGHVAVQCLAVMGFFAYIGGSSFVLQDVYGIGASTYALVFAGNALTMVAFSLGFRSTVARVGPRVLRRTGLAVATTGAALCLLVALLGPGTLVMAWVPLALMTGGMGFVLPASTALGQAAGRRAAGTAAALMGGLSFLAGAVITPLTGFLGEGTLVPMAALMTGFLALALALALRIDRP